jgi:hypothetical protein
MVRSRGVSGESKERPSLHSAPSALNRQSLYDLFPEH